MAGQFDRLAGVADFRVQELVETRADPIGHLAQHGRPLLIGELAPGAAQRRARRLHGRIHDAGIRLVHPADDLPGRGVDVVETWATGSDRPATDVMRQDGEVCRLGLGCGRGHGLSVMNAIGLPEISGPRQAAGR